MRLPGCLAFCACAGQEPRGAGKLARPPPDLLLTLISLFTLLSPSALLALLGLLVPVAIHLWNRRPGREVAVGSLRWLAAGANRRLRNLQPEQLGLLLLRAGLLALLAVALAGPVWRQALPKGRGQVLLSPELVGTPAFAALRPVVDSLRRRGYALRWLVPAFPKMSGLAWQANALRPGDSARVLATGGPSAAFRWARVQEAAGAFPGQPLYVVTPAALRGFQGSHAPLPANITWQTLPTGAAETWLQAAATRGDSLHLLLGRSTENQTAFRQMAVAQPRPGKAMRVAGLPAFRLEMIKGGSVLRPQGSSSSGALFFPVPLRTQPLRITIYQSDVYASDARYLQAGLRAAAIGLAVPLALSTTTRIPDPAQAPDWLFWLTDSPLPAAWRDAVRRGAHVWQEAAAPGLADQATLVADGAEEGLVHLFRRGAARQDSANFPIWADGQGRAVLSRRVLGRGAFFQLHTRLNPSWSELADSPALPTRLLTLLQPDPADANAPAEIALEQAAHDQRAIDPTQLHLGTKVASNTAAVTNNSTSAFRVTDLRPWLVLAAGLLFALERLLARRRDMQATPSTL